MMRGGDDPIGDKYLVLNGYAEHRQNYVASKLVPNQFERFALRGFPKKVLVYSAL